MTIMSKSSQQPPARKPDPLFQYPERYSQEDGEHQERYKRLTDAGHKVWMWKNDPAALRDYEKATAGNKPKTDEQKHKERAETKKDIEHERDHGEMRPKGPEQYSASGDDDPDYDKLLKLGVHEDYSDEMTPEQRRARIASGHVEDSGLEKPVRTRGLKPKPQRYDESSQTKPPKPKDDPPEEESEELREMRRLGGSRETSPWGRNSPQPAMPLRGGVR